jgi:hypothetical protein
MRSINRAMVVVGAQLETPPRLSTTFSIRSTRSV